MTLYLSGTVGDENLVWPLDAEIKSIGRSSKSGIHVPDATVSKEHAEVTRRGDQYFIRDLGSRNGTRVNGVEAREPVELKSGDRIEVGHLVLRVTDRAPGPEPEVRLSDDAVVGSSRSSCLRSRT